MTHRAPGPPRRPGAAAPHAEREFVGVAPRGPRVSLVARGRKRARERQLRLGQLEPGRGLTEQRDGLTGQLDPSSVALDLGEQPQAAADHPRCADAPGELEIGLRELPRRRGVPERGIRPGAQAPPWRPHGMCVGRAGELESLGDLERVLRPLAPRARARRGSRARSERRRAGDPRRGRGAAFRRPTPVGRPARAGQARRTRPSTPSPRRAWSPTAARPRGRARATPSRPGDRRPRSGRSRPTGRRRSSRGSRPAGGRARHSERSPRAPRTARRARASRCRARPAR